MANKNELSININNASDVSVENVNQFLNSSEQGLLKKEIEDLLKILQVPAEEKEKLKTKLEEAKQAIENNKPRSSLLKILGEAGNFLKDIAKEAGKTAISALINKNI